MGIQIGILTASGSSITDCCGLASRFDPSADVEGAFEAMVVHGKGDGFHAILSSPAFVDLWRSPSGRIYVAGHDAITSCDTPNRDVNAWEDQPVQSIVRQIDGVNDELVFAYGSSDQAEMYRFDGSKWVGLTPPGWFLKIHGESEDLVYGVGTQGLIARWTGSGWSTVPTNVHGVFRDVCIVSADEMYAVHENGLWEGSVHGWSLRLPAPAKSLLSVCKWRDEIWVGTAYDGLCQLKGGELVSMKGNLNPDRLDGRGEGLLMAQEGLISGTLDGDSYLVWSLEAQIELWSQQAAPHWLR